MIYDEGTESTELFPVPSPDHILRLVNCKPQLRMSDTIILK